MNIENKIKAQIVSHSKRMGTGEEIITYKLTFPRIILSEVNTYKMMEKNTSSSRAIPFEKMVEVVEKEPFLPLAWQLQHRGMQGTEYLTDPELIEYKNNAWLRARNEAVFFAKTVVGGIRNTEEQRVSEGHFDFSDKFIPNTSLSKNYGNRLIEAWTWVVQLVTGTRESFEHLFEQRCPVYPGGCKSWKELCDLDSDYTMEAPILERLQVNKGQAEIHFMDLAEKMYDALNESKPQILDENDWHIPFSDRPEFTPEMSLKDKIMLSCAMTARVSYTTIEDNDTLTLEKARKIYEKCVEQWHFSVVSHVAKCMTNKEYRSWYKGFIEMKEYVDDFNETKRFFEANDFLNAQGYNKNLKGFISLRQYVEDEVDLNNI